ncbi:MAG: hypothetical protein OEY78_13105 [Gammaproteobacteria bacterium]|nr:hypothetical protein [Gammaproteobacteria bacterium]
MSVAKTNSSIPCTSSTPGVDNPELYASTEFWQQFHESFHNHEANIHELAEWIQPAMISLHQQLLKNTEYKKTLSRAKNDKITGSDLAIPIFLTDYIQVKLISIEAKHSLPLHDHPGAAGSIFVISGDVHITEFESTDLSDSTITFVDNKLIPVGKTRCFTQLQHNIHSLAAPKNRVVIMSVHTPPFAVNSQSFYFPLINQQQQNIGTQINTQRVHTQAIQHFRNNNSK